MNADSPAQPRRILVVDDNRDAATTLTMLLRHAGHLVEQAYDGPAALKLAGEFQPEFVFLDLVMPDMDGFAVAEQLREHERMSTTRAVVVALTAFGEEAFREATTEEGFDGHLQKPCAVEALLSIVAANAPAGQGPAPAP